MRPITAVVTMLLLASQLLATDWPFWRGPHRNGIAPAGKLPPLRWSNDQNVLWATPLPGRGHGSPTIVGDRIYLGSANEQDYTQSVLAIQRETGEIAWTKVVYRNRTWPKIHNKNTHASATVACDGQRLFVSFYRDQTISHACLDLDGAIVWQKDLTRFVPEYPFGYAASPLLYRDLVIVAVESNAENALIGMQAATGKEAWRTQRKKNSSYSSPVLLEVGGREQILITGSQALVAYDPATGRELWRARGTAKHTCGTVAGAGDYVVASGGYPQSETICVKADGSGSVVWRNKQKSYEQSMLVSDGHVYTLTDQGVAYCWHLSTGKEMWRKRLGGPVSASPILVGDRIYAANEKGDVFVFRADPRRYEELARNQLGTDIFPTPVFLDGRIYARVGIQNGQERREMLYCLGEG